MDNHLLVQRKAVLLESLSALRPLIVDSVRAAHIIKKAPASYLQSCLYCSTKAYALGKGGPWVIMRHDLRYCKVRRQCNMKVLIGDGPRPHEHTVL